MTTVRAARKAATRAVRMGAGLLAVLTAAACMPGTAVVDAEAVGAPSTSTSTTPVPDARTVRFTAALSEAGLVADVSGDTLLAVARGLCDQLAAGVPEEHIVETARPIAAYAATASGTGMSGDEAARFYVEVVRDNYC